MGIQYNLIIATDGLLYCLDAANQRSYSGSGNTWFDISNNQRTTMFPNMPAIRSCYVCFWIVVITTSHIPN